MTHPAGPSGTCQTAFEDGLRFLAAALAVPGNDRGASAAVSAACDALRCFLAILDTAAERHLADPEGRVARLRNQCAALLTLRQDPASAGRHAVEAALLARDEAARLLPRLIVPEA